MPVEQRGGPKPNSEVDQKVAHEIERERIRVFTAGHSIGPLGIVASSALFVLIAKDQISQARLFVWFIAIATASIINVAAFSIRALREWTNDEGLPRLSTWSHMAVGALFGLTLGLDLDAAGDPTFRWTVLAFLFAVSAATANSRASINSLGFRVLGPLWMVAGSALLAVGQPLIAVGGFVFVALIIIELSINRQMVGELITLRVRSNSDAEQSAWAATHDTLTGLPNRQGLMEALTARTLDPNVELIAMFIDLDHFKQVNDRLGHNAGDEVLVGSAERLTECFRPGDIVGRLGGDEFLVLLATDLSLEAAQDLAERAIGSLERPFLVHDADNRLDEAFISASIGVATYPGDAQSPEQLVNLADQALYAAKRQGRRRAMRYDQSELDSEDSTSGIEAALRRALQNGGLEADAQPIFDISTGAVIWVELLARFTMPNGSRVPPSVFVPLAEEIGLAGDLMATMIDIAGEIHPQWAQHSTLADARISINASPIELARRTIVPQVADSLQRNSLDPGRLVLELAESAVIDDAASTAAQFEALRELGVAVAIHDFGVGYTSPQRLLELPIHAIKLDRRLLMGDTSEPRHYEMLRAVRALAGAVANIVIAEGIETAEQLELINGLGITAAQGYYLGHPVRAADLAAHLDAAPTG